MVLATPSPLMRNVMKKFHIFWNPSLNLHLLLPLSDRYMDELKHVKKAQYSRAWFRIKELKFLAFHGNLAKNCLLSCCSGCFRYEGVPCTFWGSLENNIVSA